MITNYIHENDSSLCSRNPLKLVNFFLMLPKCLDSSLWAAAIFTAHRHAYILRTFELNTE